MIFYHCSQHGYSIYPITIIKAATARSSVKKVFLVADKAMGLRCSYIG